MIGYSLPCSRNIAACVPATLVRIVFATSVDGQAEERRLRHDRRAPPARDVLRRVRRARRRCPACRPSCPWRAARGRGRPSRSSPRISSERRPPPVAAAREEPVHLVVAARGVGADDRRPACRAAGGADRSRSDRSSASAHPSASARWSGCRDWSCAAETLTVVAAAARADDQRLASRARSAESSARDAPAPRRSARSACRSAARPAR